MATYSDSSPTRDSPRGTRSVPLDHPWQSANLRSFTQDFLIPVFLNGQIDNEEETPLWTAFHAYWINILWEQDRESVQAASRAAIMRANAGKGSLQSHPADALQRINTIASRMTKSDYQSTRGWLTQLEGRLYGSHTVDLKDYPDGSFLATRREDRGIYKEFLDFLTKTRDEINPPVPEIEPPPKQDSPSTAAPEVPVAPTARVVDVKDGLENVSRSWFDQRQKDLRLNGQATVVAAHLLFKEGELPGLAFDSCRRNVEEQVTMVPPVIDRDIWFVGDVHGDLLSLDCALAYIDIMSKEDQRLPCIVFLGDLFDDIPFGYEVLLRVLQRIQADREGVCLLAGNHDEGLTCVDSTFTSSVSPSDFADWLNSEDPDISSDLKTLLGNLVIRLYKSVPRALLLPDGLLAVHGGVPLRDLWETIKTREDLSRPECLRDFVWTRAHEHARHKIPNRNTRGCEFGYEDLDDFCDVAEKVIGHSVDSLNRQEAIRRVIRGHDHVEERYSVFWNYRKHPVLTINTIGRRLPRESFGAYERIPCIAKWVPNELPEVHRLHIPPQAIKDVYPETPE